MVVNEFLKVSWQEGLFLLGGDKAKNKEKVLSAG